MRSTPYFFLLLVRTIYVIASCLEFNYTTMVVYCLWLLVWASQACFRSRTYNFPIQIWNILRDFFLFKFVLLCHILVVYTNLSFCEQFNINPFYCTFVHFTIVILTWHDFTSYSMVLPNSISDRLFHSLSICFRCIIYVANYSAHKVFGIIYLLRYLSYSCIF